MEEKENSLVMLHINEWDFHDLNRMHEWLGRIFVCADGEVIRWADQDDWDAAMDGRSRP